MALTDLANLDLLDAVLAHHLDDDQRERMLSTYIEAYSLILGNAIDKDLTEKDHDEMGRILASKDVTPEKIEKFYIDRIPHFQAKIVLLALEFKKKFLLSVYKNKVDEYQNLPDKTGLAAWEQVYYDAQNDNWNEVARVLRIIDGMKSTSLASPAPTAIAAK